MITRRLLIFALIGLLGGVWIAVSSWLGSPSGPARPNIVLISIDTLRADRLGCYGYGRETSPAVDGLAKQGTLFLNAVSPAHWTLPSHVSMLSGLYPSNHRARSSNMPIGGEVRLLAEVLKEQGYRTYAITGGGYLTRRLGFDRGFDLFLENRTRAAGGVVTLPSMIRRIEEELGKLEPGAPYFLFLHNYDVHSPYAPSDAYKDRFRSEGAVYIDTYGPMARAYNRMLEKLTPQKLLYLSDHYDSSIREMDDSLGGLLASLDRRADRLETIVVFTSDHGEEFMEHGRTGHERSLYRELLMVPLIIHAPWLPPRRIETPVSLVDLMPTIVELSNLEAPEGLDGASLAPFLRLGDEAPPLRPFQYAEAPKMRSSIDGKLHLIVDLQTARNQLFDFASDVRESRDLSSKRREYVSTRARELMEMSAGMKDSSRKETWVWDRFPGGGKEGGGPRRELESVSETFPLPWR